MQLIRHVSAIFYHLYLYIYPKLKNCIWKSQIVLTGIAPIIALAQNAPAEYTGLLTGVTPKVVEWWRHIHQNPELGNRECKTATYVANHLRSFGIEVREKVGVTGVVGSRSCWCFPLTIHDTYSPKTLPKTINIQH
jgi:hypothetical protein